MADRARDAKGGGKTVAHWMSHNLLKKVEKEARREHRTRSAMLSMLVEEALEARK